VRDFHDMTATIGNAAAPNFGKAGYGILGAAARLPDKRQEYAIMYSNGDVLGIYDSEAAAARTLGHERKALDRMGVPEIYWPVLNVREVETTVSSWKPLSE
jgi:hypothetical protein